MPEISNLWAPRTLQNMSISGPRNPKPLPSNWEDGSVSGQEMLYGNPQSWSHKNKEGLIFSFSYIFIGQRKIFQYFNLHPSSFTLNSPSFSLTEEVAVWHWINPSCQVSIRGYSQIMSSSVGPSQTPTQISAFYQCFIKIFWTPFYLKGKLIFGHFDISNSFWKIRKLQN